MFFKVQDASTGNHIASCLRLLLLLHRCKLYRNGACRCLWQTQASFFLDPYARPGETLARTIASGAMSPCPASDVTPKPRKRGGAWMDDCLGRSKAAHFND